ncbi:MAG: hypothetical protein AAFX08_09865 [Pseudomonadota bacterium]
MADTTTGDARAPRSLILLASAAAFGLLALFGWLGAPEGHSYVNNMPWYAAFEAAFYDGAPYPRRLDGLWFGLGGLDFFFYGPLPFWTAALLGRPLCVGCDTGTAFALGGAWLIIFSAPAFYLLARRWMGPWAAAAGAAVYALAPYHLMMDWFVRQAAGEMAAYIFFPLMAHFFTRLADDGRGGRGFALAFGGMILCHLPSALLAVHVMGALFLFIAWTKRDDRRAVVLLGARAAAWGAAGAAATALYWMPAVALLNDVSPQVLFGPYYVPSNWFFFDGAPEPDPKTTIPIRTMLVYALVACGAALAVGAAKIACLRLWIAGPLLVSVFLMSPLSALIWEHWIIASVQFPWRMMIFVDLPLALSAGYLVSALAETWREGGPLRLRAGAAATAGAFALFTAYASVWPYAMETIRDGRALDGAYKQGGAIEYFPEEMMSEATAIVKAGGNFEFDTWRGVVGDFYGEAETASAHLALDRRNPRVLRLALPAGETALIPIPYWKHWRARDLGSGAPIELAASTPAGMIEIAAVAEARQIQIYLPAHWSERVGGLLSWLALAGLFAGPLRAQLAHRRRAKAFATNSGQAA